MRGICSAAKRYRSIETVAASAPEQARSAGIEPLGDSAFRIVFEPGPPARDRVLALAALLRRDRIAGTVDVVEGHASLAVHVDRELGLGDRLAAMKALRAELEARLGQLDSNPPAPDATPGPTVEIPVAYGGDGGPDLLAVAAACALDPEDLVALHAAPLYRVELIGFLPGFAYLSGLDPRLVLPRRARPRPRVPAGSVAIAGNQAGIYPSESPGGWHLLGTTSAVLFDPYADSPCLLRAGDRVRFVARSISSASPSAGPRG